MKLRFLYISIFLFSLFCWNSLSAQELNARVIVNSDKIQGTNKNVYTSLQTNLTEFINGRKWSHASFSPVEKIDCTFTVIINQASDEGAYQGEIQVQARRPVFNSQYITTIFNYRDVQLGFSYMENTPIEYVETNIENNLVATVVFYIYIILGMDFDSFSPMGGNPYFHQAQQIASLAQSYSAWTGWTPFEKENSRHGVITALTDESLSSFRNFWYIYHRRGLDEMAANPDRGRTTIINALPALKEIKELKPGSILLQLFADCKLDELINIYSTASSQEKRDGYDMLNNIYPAMSYRLEPMKK